MEENVSEKALTLIAVFGDAIKHGYNHYTMDGERLSTTRDILEALRKDKRIQIETPKSRIVVKASDDVFRL